MSCERGLALMAFFVLAIGILQAQTEEQSVKPGINDSWKSDDVDGLVGRLERDGREVYEHRGDVVRLLDLKPGMSVADIGAGSGFMALMFAGKVTATGTVYAVDINPKMMERLAVKAREKELPQLKTVVCGERSTDLPPNSVDLVFICDTYHHFEYPKSTMASIYSALKPGGQLVLVDFIRISGESDEWIMDHVRAGKEVFSSEIVEAGFRLVDDLAPNFFRENYFLRFVKLDKES